MKQTTKRFYGTIAAVAIVSSITGAFAFSVANKAISAKDFSLKYDGPVAQQEEVITDDGEKLMTINESHSTPVQPVDLTVAAEKASDAVVYIKVTMGGQTETIEYRDPFEDFFGDFFGHGNGGGIQRRQIQTPKQQASGSGVIISTDGYIVTNNHVVEKANEITVTLNDSREFSARVIGLDPSTDLALIKIDGKDLHAITIGSSDDLKVGEWVLAIGNPFNLTSTVTAGIVSAKARNLGANRNGIESFIQTDAAINQGNSGGALVNARGELVGINAMLYSQTGSFSGYGFAIPVSIVTKVVADLQQYGTVQRALFGISGMTLRDYVDAQKQKDNKFQVDFGTNEGVYVAEVSKEGAAEEAGLKEGDIIIKVDDRKITKMSELQEATTKYHPGDKATVTFIRDKKEKTATVTFRNAKGTTKVVANKNISAIGAEFKELTEDQKKKLDLRGGLQVTKVNDGPMKKAGIAKDFIILKANNQNINSVADFEKVFKDAQASSDQTIFIYGKYPSGEVGRYAIGVEEE